MKGRHSKRWFQLGLVLVMAVTVTISAGCGKEGPTDRSSRPSLAQGVVARIGGESVPLADLETMAAVYTLLSGKPVSGPDERKGLLDQLIVQRILARDAAKQKLTVPAKDIEDEFGELQEALNQRYGSKDAVDKQMKELKLTTERLKTWLGEFLLVQTAVKSFADKISVTDAELQVYYEQNKATQFTTTEEMVRARHILLATDQEAKARDLLQQAKNGGDFAKLAKENSQDPGSGPQGGDLSYFRKGDMVPEFADLAFSLKAGEVGGPVKSQFGWHVIKVEDRRAPGVMPFEAVKDQIKSKILPDKQQEELGNYIEGLKVTEQVQASDSP